MIFKIYVKILWPKFMIHPIMTHNALNFGGPGSLRLLRTLSRKNGAGCAIFTAYGSGISGEG
jgi:hypothetical protein